MSTTLSCPFCKAETPTEHNFCVACNKQIRCLHADCNKPLLAGKTFCFGCGRPLLATTGEPQRTKYVHRVKQKGDDFSEYRQLDVTEAVAIAWAPLITGQIMGGPPQRPQPKPHDVSTRVDPPAGGLFALEADIEGQPEDEPKPERTVSLTEGAAKYFKSNGEYLVKMESDYRGKNWSDQQCHFVLLYASAYYQVLGNPVPSREHFKNAAEKASVYDKNNFSQYLNKLMNKELIEIDGGFMLSNDGEAVVRTILALMGDPKSDPGYCYWNRSMSDAVDRYRLTAKDKERIHQWAQEDVDLGKLDIRNIKKARDYALLSLWIIAIYLKKSDAIRWNEAYSYLTEKFKAISVTAGAFSKAMSSQSNETYFREGGEFYFLTPEGQKKVEGWVDGKPVEALGDEDTK